jgi:hypothetical protein
VGLHIAPERQPYADPARFRRGVRRAGMTPVFWALAAASLVGFVSRGVNWRKGVTYSTLIKICQQARATAR